MSVPDPALTDWVPIYAGSPAFTYRGDYVPATQYNDGDIVMYNGTPWLAVKNNNTPPDPFPLGGSGIPLVTALPGSPLDGQEVILVDSLTNPTYQWKMRYNAGSVQAQGRKWAYMGGIPKEISNSGAQESFTLIADTPQSLTQIAPFTVPSTGQYHLRFGAYIGYTVNTPAATTLELRVYKNTPDNTYFGTSLKVPTTAREPKVSTASEASLSVVSGDLIGLSIRDASNNASADSRYPFLIIEPRFLV